MHPLVPGFIQERFLSGESGGEFAAVGLFLDVSGFSNLTDALMSHGQRGAEVLAQVMRSIFDPIITHIFAQGGFVATSAGDSLTALFPLVDGEDAAACGWRALAAALRIQQGMAARSTFPTIYQDFTISIRVGLAEGPVRWGILTAPDSRLSVYFFQGAAIGASAAAQAQAHAGQVALTTALAECLGPGIASEPGPSGYVHLRSVQGELPLPSQDLAGPASSRQAMMQFFPEALIDLEITGEFREAVTLMVSLPWVRTETQLRLFMESVFALHDTYGGLITRLDFGDKGTNLLVFWGAPAAYENDIERALNFILDLQAITSIPISAGVTCRIAHAGFIGGRLYEEYSCSGRGVNLAARFMTHAPRGEIWVDETIARRASHIFEIEYVEEHRFKGFADLQKVYTLLERKAPGPVFYQGSLVGREAAFASLAVFLGPIFSGRPAGLMVISGEPGIGKSRLASAFLENLESDRPETFQIFLGQTDEIVREPLNPFVYWLRHYFSISADQGEARSKRSFNRKLDDLIASTGDIRLAEELDRTRSFLGALIGLRWADSLYEQLDAESRYNNTFIGLSALVRAESLRLPVVLVLEDIHLLDQDSRAFLAYLMRGTSVSGGPSYPVAVLTTSRTPLDELGFDFPDCTGLDLTGLDRSGLRGLAESLLGGPLAAGLVELLVQRAEGNPFYAEQILLYLQTEGLLVQEAEGWDYRSRQADALPVEISRLLVARLDHLEREVKEVIQTAAVLGREFDVRLLSCMLGKCDLLVGMDEVSAAEQEGIWARLSEIRCLFRHMLMREAAYQMQVHSRRQRLHAAAFEAYETLYAGDLASHYGELAFHAEQAALRDPARRYLRLAGEAARETYQNGQAVDYFTRALTLTPAGDTTGRCDLLLAREKVYEAMGQDATRQADLTALAGMLADLDTERQVTILVRQALAAVDTGHYAAAGDYAEQALKLAAPAGFAVHQSRAFYAKAFADLRRGRLEQAETYARDALRLASDNSLALDEQSCYNILGLIYTDQGRLDEAMQFFTRALILARQLGQLVHQAAPLNNLAIVARSQGDLAKAVDFYMQSLEITRQAGDRAREGLALGNLGFIEGNLGEYGKALIYLEDSLRINRESGQTLAVTYGLINLSPFAAAQGDFERAESAAREALDLALVIGDRSCEAWAQTYLGHSLLANGELDPAAEAYAAALSIRSELEQPDLATEPSAGLAQVLLNAGDLPAAMDCIAPVLAYLEAGGSLDATDEPLRVYLTCWLVLEKAGDPRAESLLETAHNLLQVRAAQIPNPDTRQVFLNNIAHHREIQAAWESRVSKRTG